MNICSRTVEDRVFHLLDGTRNWSDVAEELGMSYSEAMPIIAKVLRERGSANLVALRRALDRAASIRV
jgi:hypothetical protein